MSARTLAAFSTIRTEGAMLPSDILVRVASGDKSLGGLEESSYHLAPGEKIGEATNRAWNRLQAAWANFQSAREKLAGTDTGTSLTRERWLLPLFQLLDYGRLQAAKAEEIGGKAYAISHAWQQTPIHLVGCNVDLDRRILTAAGGMRSSPHSLLQELLNRSDQHLWGIVSNGLRLRLLRDNISLTRQAYVEFDLEAMMAGEAYPDFVLLWLLLHQSRFEAERPDQCQLEKWSLAARTEGVRVLDGLRDGVQRAIEHLGQGFLAHPGNAALREHLRSGALDRQDYYRQILRLVYRLLFLFVADDRDLLLTPTADPAAQKRYRNFYATTRLRHLATKRAGSRHHDLYCGLKVVMERLSGDGCPELALPALGSFLFSPRALPDLNACDISNLHLLEAIRSLAVTETGQSRRVVDYKNLGSEELGSVYESLLELRPDLNAEAASFELRVAAGSERKKTGSYYTPTSLISCLLDSALDPVLNEAEQQPDPETAILKLKVVDPACGSGHFLIAAAHRIAKRLSAVRTGEGEPPPEAQRKAVRDVIGHCIYGVDVNPMAVELCKVSLWMEALEPGKPLSFLEHRIQPGNSLIGATPPLLDAGIPDAAFTALAGDLPDAVKKWKKVNRNEREARKNELLDRKETQRGFAFDEPWMKLGNFAQALAAIDATGDTTIDAIHEKERRWREAVESSDYLDGQLLADAWCAAFIWKKDSLTEFPITEDVFREIERNPCAFSHGRPTMYEEVRRLAKRYGFFHWHFAFPEVFASGGFDAALGNPPWKLTEDDSRIEDENGADLDGEAGAESDSSDVKRERAFFARSGRFPLSAQNRLQIARLFAELFGSICAERGAAGMIVPSTLTVNAFDRPLWLSWVRGRALSCVWDFVNVNLLFPEVYYRQKFAVICLQRSNRVTFRARCWMTDPSQVLAESDQAVELSESDLLRYSGPELALPHFRRRSDLTRLDSAISKFGRVCDSKQWASEYVLLGATNDTDFVKQRRRASEVDRQDTESLDGHEWVPVYEGKMVGPFDHRLARVVWKAGNAKRRAQEEALTDSEKADPRQLATPLWEVPRSFIAARDPSFVQRAWDLALCDVTSALNERTAIAAAVPLCFATHNLPLVRVCGGDARSSLLFLAILGSLATDYFARLRVATNHLTEGIFNSLPIPEPGHLRGLSTTLFGDEWGAAKRALELSYTGTDLAPLAEQAGWASAPYVWDNAQRMRTQASLHAFAFAAYGLTVTDAEEILRDFDVLRRREEKEFGDFRTRTLILDTLGSWGHR